ncbi:DNA primase [Oleisolibacter albus]|uniref:DNA primase n=1 Tax=Oleisolibacter albus TaxID=2171757 RepID=UPI000DF31814|nr:DNA primase [Oleisolibacter albus]
MSLPPQFLDELRARLSLSDVVMKRMRLIRAGREFKAPCPFHNEKTPSFYVNDAKGFFHCFGCGAHGDHIAFVMRHGNLSFIEAVEQLAAEASMQVPKATPEARAKFERQKSLYDLVERAARYFEDQLRQPSGRRGYEYLRRRGLDDEAIARFRLGFAPQEGAGLHGLLTEAGYAEADMVEAGLFKRPENGRGLRAFFWNRVMFPVTDRRGRVVAFGGRIMEGDGPKYMNSADNPLFHKGNLLYGMSRARQAAADGHPLIVTEGYMDVISCVLAGFEGAVAPLGTAMTETQILELWKLAPEGRRTPILCFDGDNAGRRAAERAVERILPLLMPDHSVSVAFLPEKEDPDSLIRSGGKAAFQGVLDRARSLADVVWELEAAGRTLSDPDDRAGLEAALLARCQQIADPRVRRAYEQEMRDRLFRLVREFRPKAGGRGGPRRPQPGEIPVSRLWEKSLRRGVGNTSSRRERWLLLPLLHHPGLFDAIGERLVAAAFDDPRLDGLRQELVACLTMNSTLDAAALRRHLSERGLSETLEDLLSAEAPKFAQPGASIEAAKSGWQEVWLSSEDSLLQQEVQEAERRFRENFTESEYNRLIALKQELLTLRGLAADMPESGQ